MWMALFFILFLICFQWIVRGIATSDGNSHITGVVRPRVFGVAAVHLFADFRVNLVPEMLQVPGYGKGATSITSQFGKEKQGHPDVDGPVFHSFLNLLSMDC